MSNPTPTHADLLDRGIAKRVSAIHVALPGRVEAYDPLTQQAEVQPLIQEAFPNTDANGARTAVRKPKITSVPICFPGTGQWRMTWPINVGDTVMLIFSSSSLDAWLAIGGEVDPNDERHHDISDAMAYPGLFDFSHVPTAAPMNAMVLHAVQLLLGGPNAIDPLIRKSDLTTLISMLTSHTHSGVTTGAGISGVSAAVFTLPNGSPNLRAL